MGLRNEPEYCHCILDMRQGALVFRSDDTVYVGLFHVHVKSVCLLNTLHAIGRAHLSKCMVGDDDRVLS
jgi:hypothetical protein